MKFTYSMLEHQSKWWGIVFVDKEIFRLSFNHASPMNLRNALIESTALSEQEGRYLRLPFEQLGEIPTVTMSKKLAGDISRFISGEKVSLSQFPLYDYQCWSPFKKKVMQVVREIPYGETLSYKEVAERSCSPRASRAVGSVMATNPYPLLVPCHRVLGSGGKAGGYSAPGGLDTKRDLLAAENIFLRRSNTKQSR